MFSLCLCEFQLVLHFPPASQECVSAGCYVIVLSRVHPGLWIHFDHDQDKRLVKVIITERKLCIKASISKFSHCIVLQQLFCFKTPLTVVHASGHGSTGSTLTITRIST